MISIVISSLSHCLFHFNFSVFESFCTCFFFFFFSFDSFGYIHVILLLDGRFHALLILIVMAIGVWLLDPAEAGSYLVVLLLAECILHMLYKVEALHYQGRLVYTNNIPYQ